MVDPIEAAAVVNKPGNQPRKIPTEQEKKAMAERISSQFEFCEVTMSKNADEIRSIKGTFEIRFPSRNQHR